jgi:hypothetical protein
MTSPIVLLVISLAIVAPLVAFMVWKRVQNRQMDLRQQTIDSVIWRPGHRLTAESRQRFLDDTGTHATSRTVSEYILYAAFPIGTFLLVIFYRASFADSQLAAFNVHVGVVYFGFIVACFSRLNTLHNRRKKVQPLARTITELSRNVDEIVTDRSPSGRSRHLFGLTSAQLAILIVVFLAAFVAFTWGLKLFK